MNNTEFCWTLRTILGKLIKWYFTEIQNRNLCLEEAKITLEKQMLERNDLIEQYAAQIQSFESQLKKHVEEAAARKDLESNLLKNSDEIKEDLVEKSAVIETMKKEHEIDSEALKKEIQQLKDIIDNITKESIKEKDTLVEEHRKIVEDKENTIELRTKELESETKRHTEMHKTALEKLRADNAEQINRLSENFNKQLADKDLQISSIVKQLEEKSAEIARLVEELAKQSRLCVNKDEELANLVKRVEGKSIDKIKEFPSFYFWLNCAMICHGCNLCKQVEFCM